MKNLRIFISSPGDVRQERLIAKKVIAELNRIYGAYVHLEPIMWEDLPLEATSSFQQGIDYFVNEAPVDIAIFILWSRLGSTLGRSFLKTDGSEYRSGTEYEYDTMYALWKRTGHPKIMVYVKDAEPLFGNGLSHKEIKECLEQHERLNDFIEEKFRDRETGTNYAYWQFDKQATFEERLKIHLGRLVREHIGKDVVIKEWDGNPYRGLQSFGINESLIFCGRRELAYDVLNSLIPGTESTEVKSLLVLGESGSGKSSFVMAGLIPLIYSNDEELLGNAVFRCCPSDFNGDIYHGIYSIVRRMFPKLCGNPALDKLGDGIPDNYDSQYLQYALKTDSPDIVPTLVIDQFEELFSDSSILEDERLRTLSLLNILVQTRQVRTVIIMRNDFYSKFTAYSTLGVIKQMCVTVDVPNASVASLSDIIEEPARKADIHWEVNDQGASLSRVIREDAVKVNSLPLIEFALSELYNECADKGLMTFEAYDRIGRIRGAVAQYANRIYEALSDQEKAAFGDLLSCVVTVSHDDNEIRYVRKTSMRSAAEKTSVHKALLNKLISSHLFTSGKDAGGDATFTITHEMLITSWYAVKSWVDSQAEFIEKNDYYERLAKHWDSDGRKKKDLLYERSVLLEAEYFMFNHERKLLPSTHDFIDRSLKAQRRKGAVLYAVGFVFMILIFAASAIVLFLGTSTDPDLDDTFGIKDINLLNLLSIAIPLIATVGNATFLRLFPQYTFKTIKRTAYLWGIVLALIVADTCYEWSDGWVFQVFWLITFAFAGTSLFIEFYRRRLWTKSIFKPYVFTAKFNKIRDIVVAIGISLLVLIILGGYGSVLSEKNERYEATLEVADELFNGLNNIQNQLSWPDKLYINEKRQLYLRERFPDQLMDTIPDDREREYAQCYYNLQEPIKALSFLYPNNHWHDHFLYIMCLMKIGDMVQTEYALELYLESGRYDEVNASSTADLIWTAEKLNRFDLAEKIYAIMDSCQIDWRSTMPAALVNYGHIELSKGNRTAAYENYDNAKNLCKLLGSDDVISASLAQDLYVFQWLNVCDSTEVSAAMAHYGINPRKFYTRLDEESKQITHDVMTRLNGKWINEDSTLVMIYNDLYPICQYRYYQSALDSEYNRILTNYHCSTDSDGATFIEEFNQDSNELAISSSEIITMTDNELILRVIENGNDADRGTYRRFTKMVSHEE